jgi:hypothetical protein
MQIDPSDEIREAARRFLRVHPLRAAAGREGFLIDDTPASP